MRGERHLALADVQRTHEGRARTRPGRQSIALGRGHGTPLERGAVPARIALIGYQSIHAPAWAAGTFPQGVQSFHRHSRVSGKVESHSKCNAFKKTSAGVWKSRHFLGVWL